MTSARDVAHDLLVLAEILDQRGVLMSGVCRRGARALIEMSTKVGDVDERDCPTCGAEITRLPRGRPKIFCSDRCRRRKNAGNAKVGA